MMTPGSTPRPAAIWAMRCLGVAPDAPNAIMWLDIADAPADVPATTAPCWKRSRIASARSVPPIVDDSRSWLPPVRKTPVASRTAITAVSSLACGRVTAWSGRTRLTPSSPKTARYRSPASRPERRRGADDRDRRVRATGQRDEAAQDDAVADLVLRTADDDDGSIGHRRSRLLGSASREDTGREAATAPERASRHARMPCHDRSCAAARPPARPGHGPWARTDHRRPVRSRGSRDAPAGRRLPPGAPARGLAAARSAPDRRDPAAQPDLRASSCPA